MAAVNAKIYHDQVRNLFSRGSSAATNSPLAFMERTATATQMLLEEQRASNDNIERALNRNNKLLDKLAKSGAGGGLGISDLIMARFAGSFLSRAGAGLAMGATGGLLAARKGAGILRTGFAKLLQTADRLVIGRFGSYITEGMALISRVGKPVANLFAKLGAMAGPSGAIGQAIKVGGLVGGAGGLLTRGLGKLLLPITALLGIIDGVTGFMRADKVLGNKAGLFRKLTFAASSVIDGLLLGLPSYISKRMTGMELGSLVDSGLVAIRDGFSYYADRFKVHFRSITAAAVTKLGGLWDNMPTREDFAAFGTEIKDAVLSVGAYIKSGFVNLVENIKGWFGELFAWRPSWPEWATWSSGPAVTQPGQPSWPRRPSSAPTASPTTPAGVRPAGVSPLRLTAPVNNSMSTPNNMSTPVVPMSSAQRNLLQRSTSSPVMTPTNKAVMPNASLDDLLRKVPTPNQVWQSTPQVVKNLISTGTSVMIAMGARMAEANVETGKQMVKETSKEAGKEAAEGLVDTVQDTVKSFMEKAIAAKEIAKHIADLFGNSYDRMKDEMAKIFTEENGRVISSILGGTAASADIGAMIGGGGSSGNYGSVYPGSAMPRGGGNGGDYAYESGNGGGADYTPSVVPNDYSRTQNTGSSIDFKAQPAPVSLGTEQRDAAAASRGAQAVDYAVRAGASPVLAKAIAGNMGQEAGAKINTRIKGDNGTSLGAMQWRGVRRSNLFKFAAQNGRDPYDLETQVRFAVEETKPGSPYNDYGSVAARRNIENGQMNVRDATAEFAWRSERPNKRYAHIANRQRYADQFGGEYDGLRVTQTPQAAITNSPSGNPVLQAPPVRGQGPGTKFAHAHQTGVNPELRKMLDDLSGITGRETYVNSGYRSPAYNRKVGGARQSYHMSGQAADIDLSGYSPEQRKYIAANLARMGAGGLITYSRSPNMLHFDRRAQVDGKARYMHNYSNRNMGRAPDWMKELENMSPEEINKFANTYMPGMAQVVQAAAEKPQNPMLSAMRKGGPRGTPSTATASRSVVALSGNSQPQMQSGAAMMRSLNDSVASPHAAMLGPTGAIGNAATRTTANAWQQATEKAVSGPRRERLPVATAASAKPVLEQRTKDDNIAKSTPAAPPIKDVPVVDEMRMLSINSEILN